METILLYENGLRVEALLLAGDRDRMRAVIRGSGETIELRRIQDQWVTEEGGIVEIDALIADCSPYALERRFYYQAA